MLHEAKTMARIIRNDHVVNLQGVSEHQAFCALGSVEGYLQKHANLHYRQCVARNDYEFLLRCCSQVTAGMEFLTQKKIILVACFEIKERK